MKILQTIVLSTLLIPLFQSPAKALPAKANPCDAYNLEKLINRTDVLIFSINTSHTWGRNRNRPAVKSRPLERASQPEGEELLNLLTETKVINAYKDAVEMKATRQFAGRTLPLPGVSLNMWNVEKVWQGSLPTYIETLSVSGPRKNSSTLPTFVNLKFIVFALPVKTIGWRKETPFVRILGCQLPKSLRRSAQLVDRLNKKFGKTHYQEMARKSLKHSAHKSSWFYKNYRWGKHYILTDITGITYSKDGAGMESTLLYLPFTNKRTLTGKKSLLPIPGLGISYGRSGSNSYYELEYFQPLLLTGGNGHGIGILGLVATYGHGFYKDSDEILGRQTTITVAGALIVVPIPAFYWRERRANTGETEQEFGLMVKVPLFAFLKLLL